MRNRRLDAQALKDSIDLRDLAERYGFNGKRKGKLLTGYCPWTDDKNPSFTIYRNGYQDFGDPNNKGGLFKYIIAAKIDGAQDFADAMRVAADYLGNAPILPAAERAKTRRQTVATMPDEATQADFKAIVDTCASALHNGSPEALRALEYLTTLRGLTLETIRQARLGLSPGYDGSKQGNHSVAHGVTIPWPNLASINVRQAIGAAAEYLDPKAKRYGDSKFKHAKDGKPSAALYDARQTLDTAILDGTPVLWTESELCALLAQQTLGDRVQAVTRGSATLNASLPATLAAQFAGRRIYLALDNDDAGRASRVKLVETLLTAGTTVLNITMPAGCKDVTDAIMAGHDIAVMMAAAVDSGHLISHNLIDDSTQSVDRHGGDTSGSTVCNSYSESGDVTNCYANDVTITTGNGDLCLNDPIEPIDVVPMALPDTWRGAMLRYMHPSLPVVLDTAYRLNRAGLLSEGTFGRKDLLDAGLTRGTVDSGLDDATIDSYRKVKLYEETPYSFIFLKVGYGVYCLPTLAAIRIVLLECARYRIIERHFDGIVAYGAEDINDLVFGDLIESIDSTVDAYAIERKYSAAIEAQDGFTEARDAARKEYADLLDSLNSLSCHLITDAYRNTAEYRAAIVRIEVTKSEQAAGTGAQVKIADLAAATGSSVGGAWSARERAGVVIKKVYAPQPVTARRLSTVLRTPKTERFDRTIGGHADRVTFVRPGEDPQCFGLPHNTDNGFIETLEKKAAYFERTGGSITLEYRQADHLKIDAIGAEKQHAERLTNRLIERAKRAARRTVDNVLDAGKELARAARKRLLGETSAAPYYGLGHSPHWVALQLAGLRKLLIVQGWIETVNNRLTKDGASYDNTPANVLHLLAADPTEPENWPDFEALKQAETSDPDALYNATDRHGTAFKQTYEQWYRDQSEAKRQANEAAIQAKAGHTQRTVAQAPLFALRTVYA